MIQIWTMRRIGTQNVTNGGNDKGTGPWLPKQ